MAAPIYLEKAQSAMRTFSEFMVSHCTLDELMKVLDVMMTTMEANAEISKMLKQSGSTPPGTARATDARRRHG